MNFYDILSQHLTNEKINEVRENTIIIRDDKKHFLISKHSIEYLKTLEQSKILKYFYYLSDNKFIHHKDSNKVIFSLDNLNIYSKKYFKINSLGKIIFKK